MNMPEKSVFDKTLSKLREILRLQDVDIRVFTLGKAEFKDELRLKPDENFVGWTQRNLLRNGADIFLNVDADENWYTTLIHELLHVLDMEWFNIVYTLLQENSEAENEIFKMFHEKYTDKLTEIISNLYPLERILECGGDK